MGARRLKTAGNYPPQIKTIRALNVGSRLRCIDNSGAKKVEIVAVMGYKGIRSQRPKATIGDMIVVTVKEGSPDLRKKLAKAIITTMRKEFMRPSGSRIMFEENTCILVDDEGKARGSEIKCVVAKEAVMRWPTIGKIAKVVV